VTLLERISSRLADGFLQAFNNWLGEQPLVRSHTVSVAPTTPQQKEALIRAIERVVKEEIAREKEVKGK
jgi:hypothetical protein